MNIGLSNQTQTQIAESETQAYTLSGEKILFTDRTGTGHEISVEDLAEYMGYDNYLVMYDRMMRADEDREAYFVYRMEEWVLKS